jgi:hypothetical protein
MDDAPTTPDLWHVVRMPEPDPLVAECGAVGLDASKRRSLGEWLALSPHCEACAPKVAQWYNQSDPEKAAHELMPSATPSASP